MCGALPKACHGHPIALHPVPDPPTVQVLLRALKDRLPLNTVTDSDFLFSTSVGPDVLSEESAYIQRLNLNTRESEFD